MNGISILDTCIFAGYFILIMVVGLISGKGEGKSAREYFLAGGRLPWYLIGFSLVAASINSEQMVGTVGIAYKEGMKIVNWEVWGLPTQLILVFMFVPIYLRNRLATVPEFMERRFGAGCRNYISILTVVSYVLASLSVATYGGALTLSNYFGINFHVAIWGIIIFVGIYTIYGGLSSVVWTDIFQTVLMISGGFVLFYFCYSKIPGGFKAMEAANPERWHLIQPVNDLIVPWPGLIIHTFTTLFFYFICSQFLMQKLLAARSDRDARVGCILSSVINIPRPLLTAMAGLLAFYLIDKNQITNHDETFAVLLKTVVPEGFRSLILVAFLAAMVSTIAALANSASTLITFDIYSNYVNKNATTKQMVRFGRILTATILIFVGLWCPMVGKFSGIFLYFQKSMSYFGTPIACVFLLGILWKRANGKGALAAMAITTPLMFIAEGIWGGKIAFQYIAGIGWIVTLIIMVVVSLMTQKPDYQAIEGFVWRKEMIKPEDDEKKVPLYMRLWVWILIAAMGMAFWYIRFW